MLLISRRWNLVAILMSLWLSVTNASELSIRHSFFWQPFTLCSAFSVVQHADKNISSLTCSYMRNWHTCSKIYQRGSFPFWGFIMKYWTKLADRFDEWHHCTWYSPLGSNIMVWVINICCITWENCRNSVIWGIFLERTHLAVRHININLSNLNNRTASELLMVMSAPTCKICFFNDTTTD